MLFYWNMHAEREHRDLVEIELPPTREHNPQGFRSYEIQQKLRNNVSKNPFGFGRAFFALRN